MYITFAYITHSTPQEISFFLGVYLEHLFLVVVNLLLLLVFIVVVGFCAVHQARLAVGHGDEAGQAGRGQHAREGGAVSLKSNAQVVD
jgi:hypothetical protein